MADQATPSVEPRRRIIDVTGRGAAELAENIEDVHHGRGIGTRLLRSMLERVPRLSTGRRLTASVGAAPARVVGSVMES